MNPSKTEMRANDISASNFFVLLFFENAAQQHGMTIAARDHLGKKILRLASFISFDPVHLLKINAYIHKHLVVHGHWHLSRGTAL
jgi:hypothetical protein